MILNILYVVTSNLLQEMQFKFICVLVILEKHGITLKYKQCVCV